MHAFSSVGQNLFGEAVFDAVTVPPNPIFPQGRNEDSCYIGPQEMRTLTRLDPHP